MSFEQIEKLAVQIKNHAFKRGYVSAFTLTAFPDETGEDLVLHITRECDGLVYGNAEVGSLEAFRACVKALDGNVDYIVYDLGLKFDFDEFISGDSVPENSTLLPYSDLAVWVESVRYMLLTRVPDLVKKHCVLIGIEHNKDLLLARMSIDLSGIVGRMAIHFHDGDYSDENRAYIDNEYMMTDIVIGAAIYSQVITVEQLEKCKLHPLIVDAGIGTLTPDAADYARSNGMELMRVDNRAAMAGMLFSLIQSYDLTNFVMGQKLIDDIPVVAGGVIGSPGTIIIDSIENPSMVIGFADGTGRVRYQPADESESEKLLKVKRAIGEEISE